MSGLNDLRMKQGPERPKPLSQEEAESFVKRGLRPAKPEEMHARCVDGRYEPGAGVISMAGGDLGLLAVGYAAMDTLSGRGISISRDTMKDAVLKVIGGGDRGKGIEKFHYHTDEESIQRNGTDGSKDKQGERFFGCGHCKRLLTGDGYYLNETLKGYLRSDLDEIDRAGTKPYPLKGGHHDHRERAVFVVQRVRDLHAPNIGADENLLSFEEGAQYKPYVLDSQVHVLNENARSQAFVYNRGAVNLRLRALAETLVNELDPGNPIPEVTESVYNILKEVEQVHLGNTVGALAAGLPVYDVFVDPKSGEEEVVKRPV